MYQRGEHEPVFLLCQVRVTLFGRSSTVDTRVIFFGLDRIVESSYDADG